MPDRSAAPLSQTVDDPRELSIAGADGVTLSGEEPGNGPAIGGRRAAPVRSRPGRANPVGGADPVVLLHGLTATRRYVVMGSRSLERSGYRVIAYDARGHGRSTPADGPRGYAYEHLAADLLAVLDATGVQRALLAGVSMGAHTAVRFALEHPERVAALAIVTPAFDPTMPRGEVDISGWDALARGLRQGGVEGFVSAYDLKRLPESLRATVETVLRQRIAAHEHPDAVADALEGVPRSRPFERLEQLATIAVPTAVVASRDEADPLHPLVVGRRYAQAIPGAELHVEDEGRSPLAWQGGQISRVLAQLAARAGHVS
jgi:pimeloyl-ACP methyl ester carboxylesterase